MFNRDKALEAIDKELTEFGKVAKKLGGSVRFMFSILVPILETMRNQGNGEKTIKAMQREMKNNRWIFYTKILHNKTPENEARDRKEAEKIKMQKESKKKFTRPTSVLMRYRVYFNDLIKEEEDLLEQIKIIEDKLKIKREGFRWETCLDIRREELKKAFNDAEMMPTEGHIQTIRDYYDKYDKDITELENILKNYQIKKFVPEGVFRCHSPVLGPRLVLNQPRSPVLSLGRTSWHIDLVNPTFKI